MLSFPRAGPLGHLLEVAALFVEGGVSIDVLQGVIANAETSVTEYELRDLRTALRSAGNALEFGRFMMSDADAMVAAREIALDVAAVVRRSVVLEEAGD